MHKFKISLWSPWTARTTTLILNHTRIIGFSIVSQRKVPCPISSKLSSSTHRKVKVERKWNIRPESSSIERFQHAKSTVPAQLHSRSYVLILSFDFSSSFFFSCRLSSLCWAAAVSWPSANVQNCSRNQKYTMRSSQPTKSWDHREPIQSFRMVFQSFHSAFQIATMCSMNPKIR